MGVMKDYYLQKHWEEWGESSLTWSQVKAVLRSLIREFSPAAEHWAVQQAIEDRNGVADCGVAWPEIRLMLNNLGELYFTDLCLKDLYAQIRHYSDRFDSLADKVERQRKDVEFDEALARD
jgi:hypothetical protein